MFYKIMLIGVALSQYFLCNVFWQIITLFISVATNLQQYMTRTGEMKTECKISLPWSLQQWLAYLSCFWLNNFKRYCNNIYYKMTSVILSLAIPQCDCRN